MPTAARRITVLVASLALTACVFATPSAAQEMETVATVELSPKNDTGIRGTATIRESEAEEYEEEAEEAEEAEEEEMHAHEILLQLEGLEPGQSYPAHVHQGTCAEGGPVLVALESVQADDSGRGTSTTTISPEDLPDEMKELPEEMEGEEAPEHPPVFLQAHLPDGTPAACGDVRMSEEDAEGSA